jgi:CheY-like chemotaxis protein
MRGMQDISVLIVEDNSALLDMLLETLPLCGPFRVFGAADGVAGLERLEEVHPQCVVVDVKMPELNGYQLVRLLRGDPDTASIPVILLTALAQERDRFVGLVSGADRFLTKPVRPTDLAQVITEVLALTEQHRQDTLRALLEAPFAQEEKE